MLTTEQEGNMDATSKYEPEVTCQKLDCGSPTKVCGHCQTCGKQCGDTIGCPECDYFFERTSGLPTPIAQAVRVLADVSPANTDDLLFGMGRMTGGVR